MTRTNLMSIEDRKLVAEQIKIALDGRTQRWLALEVKIADPELSKKMNAILVFTQAEIDRINARLKCNIQLPVGTEQ